MSGEPKRPGGAAHERVLPGVWRLRLPLPWPGVPHGNVWAVAADGGIVLFDTGIGGKGGLRQLRPRPRPGRLRARGRAAARLHPLPHRPLRAGGADRRGRRLRALDAPGLGARAAARRRPRRGARAADRGGPPERRPGGGAGALPRVAQRRRRDRDRRDRRARPRPPARGRGGDRPRRPGRSTRPPATPPRTSSSTSPSAS